MKKNILLKPSIILASLLLLAFATLFYYGCAINYEDLRANVIDLNENIEKKDSFILDQNKGLTMELFKRKFHITRTLAPYEVKESMIYFSRLYFHFNENGFLESIE